MITYVHMNRTFIIGVLMLLSAPLYSETLTYTTSFAGSEYGKYHIAVLRAAIAETQDTHGEMQVRRHVLPMTQSRQVVTLLKGQGDVMWSVTSDALEQRLLPVRFPLLQGFGGYRVFVIHKNMQPFFQPTQSLAHIRNLVSVQGEDWPDFAILKDNQFKVAGSGWTNWYTTMYKSLERGMVDYFPRNIVEVHRDMEYHKNPHLVIEQNHMLVYPSYEFFFVSPARPELQKRLEEGMVRLLENGKLSELFRQNSEHRKALKLLDDSPRVIHRLDNNVLSYSLKYPNWEATPQQSLDEFRRLQQHAGL